MFSVTPGVGIVEAKEATLKCTVLAAGHIMSYRIVSCRGSVPLVACNEWMRTGSLCTKAGVVLTSGQDVGGSVMGAGPEAEFGVEETSSSQPGVSQGQSGSTSNLEPFCLVRSFCKEWRPGR